LPCPGAWLRAWGRAVAQRAGPVRAGTVPVRKRGGVLPGGGRCRAWQGHRYPQEAGLATASGAARNESGGPVPLVGAHRGVLLRQGLETSGVGAAGVDGDPAAQRPGDEGPGAGYWAARRGRAFTATSWAWCGAFTGSKADNSIWSISPVPR